MESMIAIGALRVVDAKEVTFLAVLPIRKRLETPKDGCTISYHEEYHIHAHVAGANRTVEITQNEPDAFKLLIEYAAVLGMIRIKKRVYAHPNTLVALTVHDHITEYGFTLPAETVKRMASWYVCMQFRMANGNYARLLVQAGPVFRLPARLLPKQTSATAQPSTADGAEPAQTPQ